MRKTRKPKKRSNSKPRSKSEKSLQVMIVAGALLVSGIFYFSARGRRASDISAKPLTALPAAQVRADIIVSKDTSSEPKVTEEAISNLRLATLEQSKLKIVTAKVKGKNGVIQIPFIFKAEKRWCQAGDLDTLHYLIPSEKATEVLVTLESLSSSSKSDPYRTSLRGLLSGFRKTFAIRTNEDVESIGLFICRDSEKTGSCKNKILKTHQEIGDALADTKAGPSAAKKDYIIFFQNFIVSNGQLVSYGNDNFEKATQLTLARHLKTAYKLEDSEVAEAWKYNSTLKSLPAIIANNRIVLNLPYNDPRCLNGKK